MVRETYMSSNPGGTELGALTELGRPLGPGLLYSISSTSNVPSGASTNFYTCRCFEHRGTPPAAGPKSRDDHYL
jgi:hypothetical protein